MIGLEDANANQSDLGEFDELKADAKELSAKRSAIDEAKRLESELDGSKVDVHEVSSSARSTSKSGT